MELPSSRSQRDALARPAFKEVTGGFNRGIDTRIVGTVGDVPHAFGVLEQFGAFSVTFFVPQRRQNHRQRLGVIRAVHRRQLVAEHVGSPVLRHACADQAVQRLVAAHITLARTS